jgi:hypothetical protein
MIEQIEKTPPTDTDSIIQLLTLLSAFATRAKDNTLKAGVDDLLGQVTATKAVKPPKPPKP